jgi:uncharacterized protein YbjT (DUF2867 family)
MSRKVLVIGGTGAQGSRVVRSLLASDSNFSVRVLSRDPEIEYVKNVFAGLTVELVKGEQRRLKFQDLTDAEKVPGRMSLPLKKLYGIATESS